MTSREWESGRAGEWEEQAFHSPALPLSRSPAERAAEVTARLSRAYGPPPPLEPDENPLDGLIGTILSQHTSDINSARAHAALMARFGSLAAVREAALDEVEAVIRSGGLARVKSLRIKQALEQLQAERGELSLDFLRTMSLPAARAFLTGLNGVGMKTASCVLLFNCGLPAIPVDTHVHRVSRRLGLIGPRTNADRAHAELEALVPPDQAYAFHVNLIRHGRRTCKALRPRCHACPLEDLCPKVGQAGFTTKGAKGTKNSSSI